MNFTFREYMSYQIRQMTLSRITLFCAANEKIHNKISSQI